MVGSRDWTVWQVCCSRTNKRCWSRNMSYLAESRPSLLLLYLSLNPTLTHCLNNWGGQEPMAALFCGWEAQSSGLLVKQTDLVGAVARLSCLLPKRKLLKMTTTALKALTYYRFALRRIVEIPWFTHPQAILGVYDFLLSDKYNPSYIKNVLAL